VLGITQGHRLLDYSPVVHFSELVVGVLEAGQFRLCPWGYFACRRVKRPITERVCRRRPGIIAFHISYVLSGKIIVPVNS